MKFGRNLHRYQVLEWTPFYIDYQALKQLYKAAKSLAVDCAGDADLTDFRALLEQHMSKARSFYKSQHELLQQRVRALRDHYGLSTITDLEYASGIELIDLRVAFMELRSSLKQLLWYWLVNFDKIIGSLTKFQKDLHASDADVAILTESIEDLCQVNDWLKRIPFENLGGSPGLAPRKLLQQRFVKEDPCHLLLINVLAAIEQNDTVRLYQDLRRSYSISEIDGNSWQQFSFALLYFSAVSGSQRCTVRLLSDIGSFQDFGDHIHWLISKIGRRKMLHDRHTQALNLTDSATPGIAPNTIIDQLVHIITRLGIKLDKAFQTKDSLGRIPLHYAVQYDLPQVCQEILKHMGKSRGSYSVAPPSPALIPDREGLTSLDLAVLNGSAAVLTILLEDYQCGMEVERFQYRQSSQEKVLPGNLLTNALELGSFEIIRALHRSMIDLKHTDHNGNTALHLAVRSGKIECVTEILQGCNGKSNLDLNARDIVYGWNPLILASVRGDLAVVELLLQAGADPNTPDHFGWKAKDHAAFRGWLPAARKLAVLTPEHSKDQDDVHRLHQQRRAKSGVFATFTGVPAQKVSSNQSQIYVNLGALDTYNPVTAVDMSPYVWPDPYDPQREAEFYVEVRAINESQAANVVQLPILEDMANKPWRFVTNNVKDFKLAFNIHHSKTSGHKGNSLVGSAIALLDNLKQGFGPARESLIRNFTIPILRKDTLDLIGTVTFYILIVTPFPQPDPNPATRQGIAFLNSEGLPIIGHRGIGQNDPSRRQLQIGENTIESFQSAKELGASYVEFGTESCQDVQLTKDNVPIIYHDFLMSETGIDAPLHNLNLEQFMHISNAQSTEDNLLSMAEKRYLERSGDPLRHAPRQRSHSLNAFEHLRAKGLIERMKHTFEYKLNESKGFNSYKGNIRSEYIQAPFVTLEDLFMKLPDCVNFAMEIKYPMLSEAHDWEMETIAVEANHLVDNILDRVYRLASKRAVFFSSFSPEVCILLSNKQHLYPVFFLTESGHVHSSDARADSLQEAIWFAQSWRLAGVISRSDPLVVSPQLIEYVKDAGLLCLSWGGLNDVAEHAQTQANAGLDAIITNNIKLISQTLNKRKAPP